MTLQNKLKELLDKRVQLDLDLSRKLPKSILQEAIQGKLVPQDPSEGTTEELLRQIKAEKVKLVKEGKLKKQALADSTIYKGDDNRYWEKLSDGTVECINDEIPFELPYNWDWVRFGTIVRTKLGKTPPRGDSTYWSNGLYNWVSISDMTDYGTIKNTKEKLSKLSEPIMGDLSPKGTLIMSFKLTVGRTSLLGIPAYHNEAIISIFPFIDVDYSLRNYLFYILPLISNLGDSKDAIKGKTLNSSSVYNLLIPLPPLKEGKRIVTQIEKLFEKL